MIYNVALYYYELQSYTGSYLANRTYLVDKQFVRINRKSMAPNQLAQSDAMRNYLTGELEPPSKQFESQVA